ncbi:MAG TPA: ATP-dependent sacrificial sulfur transferase LarE [Candidatus Dormibacteraeota bacterium]|nr:ATP-dependent sacrificial sulfur transferase LarE [Candidatus Dormibacteraeota bacterium]
MEGPYSVLRGILRDLGPCLVAFSGGVDSTFLLRVAHDVLGDGVTAVTAVSPSLAAGERQEAEDLARLIGARHLLVQTGELDDPRYVRNDGSRCYYCKSELFRVLGALLASAGGGTIVYGAITDDLGDDRPGMRAAAESGVRAPLIEAGLTKAMIRVLSRRLGLPTWNKPAMACLASRIPRLVPVTRDDLWRVERAEAAVRALGYRQVRVRMQGRDARVELDHDGLLRCAPPRARRRLILAVRSAGFLQVVVDPQGYRPGGRPPAPPAPMV